ncbi:putative cation efflux protein [Helianthus anomalus]
MEFLFKWMQIYTLPSLLRLLDQSSNWHGHGHDHSDEDVEDVNIHGVSKYPADETKEKKKKKKKKRNINVQAACLHVLGDSIQSIGVTIGATVIWYNPNFKVIDPICTLLFSVIVTPREIDATSLEHGLCEIDEVVAIHELHIWAITVGKVLLACHVRIRREVDADMVLDKVVDFIKREYNINHVTIQIERE